MNDERAKEIAAALDEYDKLGEQSFYETSDHDNIRARQIQDDMVGWLRELLAERERLMNVIKAARELHNATQMFTSRDRPLFLDNAMQKYEQALAALEGQG